MIETIRSSYGIRFETTLNSICLSKSRSALEYINFVSSAVCDLLKFRLISEVLTPSSVVNLSLVSVHLEGKPSLILYLRHVNGCIPKAKFRNKDWKVFLQCFSRGGYMYKFDLKSRYRHIDISQLQRQSLGVQLA